jgi:hypothetical protein
MTSLPVAPARTTLAEAPHPGDLTGAVTVVARVPVANGAMTQTGVRAGAPAAAGRSVMTGVLLVEVPAGVTGGASGDRIGASIVEPIVVLGAGQIARASGVVRC